MFGIIALVTVIGITLASCRNPASNYPPLTGTVSISGVEVVGDTLTTKTDSLDGSGTIYYQWKQDGITIIGTNSNTYIVQDTDLGYIRKKNGVSICEAVRILLDKGIIQKIEDLETGYYLEGSAYLEEVFRIS